jgi:ATP-binding cassette subfamily C (CFTR/MRP) protein 1
VSIRRINQYLAGDELESDAVKKTERSKGSMAIRMSEAAFSWGDDGTEQPNILSDIDLTIPKGQLVAVVGSVGAGKSSLLSALLGDMVKKSGQVQVNGRIAYVPQQAWIQNATIRDNVLFSLPYVERRYEDVLKRSQLLPDLRLLSAGDLTEIGEKGINLSGGQKQRVSIARALYAEAEIYLFDDPLSALDSQVGRQVFDQVIGEHGMLAGRTRVLVTHRIALLPQVDQIVVLNNGQVAECGSYAELLAAGGEFSNLIAQYLCENELEVTQQAEPDELQLLAELKQKVQPQLEQLQQSLSISVENSRRRQSMHASRLMRSESMQIEQRQRKQASASATTSPAGKLH